MERRDGYSGTGRWRDGGGEGGEGGRGRGEGRGTARGDQQHQQRWGESRQFGSHGWEQQRPGYSDIYLGPQRSQWVGNFGEGSSSRSSGGYSREGPWRGGGGREGGAWRDGRNDGGGGGGGAWRDGHGGSREEGGAWKSGTSPRGESTPSVQRHDHVPEWVVPKLQSMKLSEELTAHPSGSLVDSNRILPVKRPDKGGSLAIRTVRLHANHFCVKFSPETVIMQYDVSVKAEVGRPRKIPKGNLSIIRHKLSSDDPESFPLSMTAYDGGRNIFSAISLPTGQFKVEVPEGEDMKAGLYVGTIKLRNRLKLRELNDYLSGYSLRIPRDILQGMDLVMKENPARHMISIDRHFFPKEEDHLGWGLTACKGFQHSLRPTSQGLAMCLDYSVLAFRKHVPVIDFLWEHIAGFTIYNFHKFRKQVHDTLKGLKVYVTHRRTKRKFTIAGLTVDDTCDVSFIVDNGEGQSQPREVRIVDHFREKYDKDIMFKNIPCLEFKGNKKNYMPMEFCVLVEGQVFSKELLEALDRKSALMLNKISLAKPKSRESGIYKMVHSEEGPCSGGLAEKFGIAVDTTMTTVTGRVIGPPELKLGSLNGKVIKVTVDQEKCNWNLVGKAVVEGRRIDRWGVIDFSSSDTGKFKLDNFISSLIGRCRSLGIHMEEPLIVKRTTMNKFLRLDTLHELLEIANQEAYKCGRGCLQFLLCVMSRRHNGYKYLKWISETQVGIVTQCCLSTNKASDQYFANLAMKINAKLGGTNVELNDFLPHFDGKGHVMFVGADVNHPNSQSISSRSIVAVVATMNWPAANRYAARVRSQHPRQERILNFGDICLELIESYVRHNNVRPDKIVIFRDGVSESQFDMVLNEELLDLKTVLQTMKYSPTITIIVAQKGHQTRLFPESTRDGDSTGNVSPGTVVDTRIVHPFEFDFYLCSHYGTLGTSKPTHYHVLWDEHGFTSDQLQKLIYDMCFTFARCTKPVALVPPVYYADLVAYRGRLYFEAAMEGQSTRLASSSRFLASLVDQNSFKLHADLENIMFFV